MIRYHMIFFAIVSTIIIFCAPLSHGSSLMWVTLEVPTSEPEIKSSFIDGQFHFTPAVKERLEGILRKEITYRGERWPCQDICTIVNQDMTIGWPLALKDNAQEVIFRPTEIWLPKVKAIAEIVPITDIHLNYTPLSKDFCHWMSVNLMNTHVKTIHLNHCLMMDDWEEILTNAYASMANSVYQKYNLPQEPANQNFNREKLKQAQQEMQSLYEEWEKMFSKPNTVSFPLDVFHPKVTLCLQRSAHDLPHLLWDFHSSDHHTHSDGETLNTAPFLSPHSSIGASQDALSNRSTTISWTPRSSVSEAPSGTTDMEIVD